MMWLLLSLSTASAADPFLGWPVDGNQGLTGINNAWLYADAFVTTFPGKCHKGLDLFGADGTTVLAAHDGVVERVWEFTDNVWYELTEEGDIEKDEEGRITTTNVLSVAFVPLTGGH